MELVATTSLKIVSMISFNDKIYLATEYGIYVHDPKRDGDAFQPMSILVRKDG